MMPEQNSRWHMPLFIRITLLLHAAMLVLVIVYPQLWKWALAAIIFNHVLITIIGLWPRSHWLGPNWTRLPAASAARGEIALTIDDGPNPEVTPQVLELLDRHGIKATFFCIGEHAAKYPELCKTIVARGHTIENHSQHHFHHFSIMGMHGLTQEIRAAQDTISAITGRRPEFFRAPAGLRNPFLDPVLTKLGLRLAAWTKRGFDTRTADAVVVCRRLMRDLKAGSILLLHDGNCARTPNGIPVILDVLPRLIESANSAGLRFVTLSRALELT
jgi:peptidoglycan/xylan/chitin deacetylase (PgdA/CDA1 family)